MSGNPCRRKAKDGVLGKGGREWEKRSEAEASHYEGPVLSLSKEA